MNREDAQGSNLASIFGELSHRKNISETRLPLAGAIFFRGDINATVGSIKDGGYFGGLILHVTLPVKMFGPFWSVWCKMALAEVGMSLP